MSVNKRLWLRSALMLAVGLLAFVLVLRRVDIRNTIETLRGASLPFVLLAAGALCMFYFLRAARWSVILKRRVSPFPLFLYSSIGYLASSVLPLQAGELLKPGFLRIRHNIPYFEGLSSVMVERLLDVLSLVFLGLMSLIAIPTFSSEKQWITESLRIAAVVSAVGLGALTVIVVRSPQVVRIGSRVLDRMALPQQLKVKALTFVNSLIEGATVIKSPGLFFSVIGLSLALWMINYVSVLLVFWAFGSDLPPAIILLGFVVLSVGLTLPFTPGYIGQYEGLWVLVYLTLGARTEALVVAMGILSHVIILFVIALLGLSSLMFIPGRILHLLGDARLNFKPEAGIK